MATPTDVPPAPTDEALLQASAAGDRRAFEALLARHGDALFRFAIRTCGPGREVEDAVQDGLLDAWRGARTFRGEASARTWLFQIVIHACRRRARRRVGEPDRHEALDEAVELAAPQAGPESRAAAGEERVALERAVAALPDEAREVLLLRDVEGLSGEETAAALGLGLAAMKSRLHRARLELKERVEALLGNPVQEVRP